MKSAGPEIPRSCDKPVSTDALDFEGSSQQGHRHLRRNYAKFFPIWIKRGDHNAGSHAAAQDQLDSFKGKFMFLEFDVELPLSSKLIENVRQERDAFAVAGVELGDD